jgi:hypothetical protein
MTHFAQLDENNKVLQVIVVSNDELMENGVESEHKGIAFCKTLLGADTNWVQTSYNATIRKNYAGIGYTYDSVRDAFISPKTYNSWVLNEETCNWEAPTPYPSGDGMYKWVEDDLNWQLVESGA